MSMTRLLLLAVPLAVLGACKGNVMGPATDCAYDKTAASAPGYQLCTPSAQIQSVVPPADAGAPSVPDGFTWAIVP
jgi:hypothetical protein